MLFFPPCRILKCTYKRSWTCTRSTMRWWCQRLIMTQALWLHLIRFVFCISSCFLLATLFMFHSGFMGFELFASTTETCSLLQACGRFINNNAITKMAQSSSKSPELLARYCDSLLKKRWSLLTHSSFLFRVSVVNTQAKNVNSWIIFRI